MTIACTGFDLRFSPSKPESVPGQLCQTATEDFTTLNQGPGISWQACLLDLENSARGDIHQ